MPCVIGRRFHGSDSPCWILRRGDSGPWWYSQRSGGRQRQGKSLWNWVSSVSCLEIECNPIDYRLIVVFPFDSTLFTCPAHDLCIIGSGLLPGLFFNIHKTGGGFSAQMSSQQQRILLRIQVEVGPAGRGRTERIHSAVEILRRLLTSSSASSTCVTLLFHPEIFVFFLFVFSFFSLLIVQCTHTPPPPEHGRKSAGSHSDFTFTHTPPPEKQRRSSGVHCMSEGRDRQTDNVDKELSVLLFDFKLTTNSHVTFIFLINACELELKCVRLDFNSH